jgi:serine/threonine protein kinase
MMKSEMRKQNGIREFTWDDITLPVEQYKLQEPIGEGVTAVIYKAAHPVHKWCAVKAYHNDSAFQMDVELSFLETLSDHENFVKVYDIWRDDLPYHEYRSYLAMTLVDGKLLDLIEFGMTSAQVLECVQQLVDAIAIMHARDIVHFDLKPENIGFTRMKDGRIKYTILDFGSAQRKSKVYSPLFQYEMNHREIVLTSLFYRPYETVLLDGQLHTEKTDIWSLGCIIYEMITKTPLFEELDETMGMPYNRRVFTSGLARMKKIASTQTAYGNVLKVMEHCLEINTEDRYEAYELVRFVSS